jgi:hypothetical protein
VLSKILELLHYNKKRDIDKKERREDFPDLTVAENFDSNVREKLANTYIFNPAKASEHVIRKQGGQSPHKDIHKQADISIRQLFPWLISFLAILLLLVNIAYRGKVSIRVEFLDTGAAKTGAVLSEPAKELKDTPGIFASTPLISEGYVNSYIIKKLGFYGAAISKSRILQDGLYLFNDGTTGWASVGIDLPGPMDLSGMTLNFFVKGEEGGESLKLTLRDSQANSYMPQATNTVFNKNMDTDWKFASIPFMGFEGAYDPEKIKHIGLEFGTQTTSNEPGSLIHIKNINIVKNSTLP